MPDERDPASPTSPEAIHIRPAHRASHGSVQWRVAELADRQHGVISRAELVGRGLSASAVDRWAHGGRLRRLYPSVYALGHAALTTSGRRLAAVLACGPDAGMSFTDGGAVWGVCTSHGTRFHVTVPHGSAQFGPRRGIHVHVTRKPVEIVVHDGIPVTSVAQTLRDIATVLSDEEVGEEVDQAIVLDLYDQRAIDAVCGRGRPGSARLQRVIAKRHPDAQDTRSRWEKRMLRLLDAHDVPRPSVNRPLVSLGVEPDLLWPTQRVVVEWDSWTHHRARGRFEADRAKTIALQNAGFTVLRFTWAQTHHQPELVVHTIRTALSRSDPYSAR